MTSAHKTSRVQWAVERTYWTGQWHIFLREKLNLDGPDGVQYYWYDLHKAEPFLGKIKRDD